MALNTHLEAVEHLLLSSAESSIPLLTHTTTHILRAGGKRLRPRLVLLAYEASGGRDSAVVVPLAAAVEIIHTATLVHDDINDHGTLRRGRETVNSRWGGTYALLTGDYMFTKTYEIMAPYSKELNLILARAAIELVEGETLQIEAAKRGSLDENTYIQIIAKKTAALFVGCVQLGAVAAEAPPAWVDALTTYAFNLGMAFQIVDDLLDLSANPEQLGKDAGIDLSQGRGIAAVREGNGDSRVATLTAAAVAVDPETAPAPLKDSLLDGDNLKLAIDKGRRKARQLAEQAAAALDVLPESDALDALRDLARQVIERDH